MRLLTLVALVWMVAPQPYEEAERRSHQCPMNVQFVSYPVSGSSAEELRASMLERGPKDKLGKARFAYTDWRISWKWQKDARGRVDSKSLSLSCTAQIIMPRLMPTRETPIELINSWYIFAERVRQHELRHVQHARERAGLVISQIEEQTRRHGPLTPARANAIAFRVVADIRGLDRAYDVHTNHGESEGVWEIL